MYRLAGFFPQLPRRVQIHRARLQTRGLSLQSERNIRPPSLRQEVGHLHGRDASILHVVYAYLELYDWFLARLSVR